MAGDLLMQINATHLLDEIWPNACSGSNHGSQKLKGHDLQVWGKEATTLNTAGFYQEERETETVEHLLCHCPTLFGARQRLMVKKILPKKGVSLVFKKKCNSALFSSIQVTNQQRNEVVSGRLGLTF